MPEVRRIVWSILLRVVIATGFLAALFMLHLPNSESYAEGALGVMTRLVIATYLFSLISLISLRFSGRQLKAVSYAQIVWDLFLVTTLILITGGVASPYAFLYFLSIVSASVLLSRSEAYYTASLCVILYGSILDFQYYGRLIPLGLGPTMSHQVGAGYVFYLIFLYSLSFYLIAFLAGSLSERARVSETALKEKVVDYEELERLHSSIVSTIDSALVTLSSGGKIRVFNRYAELLTGFSQQEAYDRPVDELFPGLSPYLGGVFGVSHGDFVHHAKNGHELLLSFKSVPLAGKEGDEPGALLDINDLTDIKRMAGELKRADRLAAIGELSARMAHEIRNPLAAISGSVQLVSQREGADEKDRRLFSIIVRETDRLDTLLRDFLLYAKPSQPAPVPLNLRRQVADVVALLGSDPRLAGVNIDNRVPGDLVLTFDKDHCAQIFWNLFVNGAEAMAGGGEIQVEAEQVNGEGSEREIRICVSDDGSGMSDEVVKRVFEPFFTTKKGGTGLGLATVYRIVETHGGRVSVASRLGGGTMVTLYLPS
ncbi:PAS domain-containing sensor histidine kinase [Geomonas sp. Red276]